MGSVMVAAIVTAAVGAIALIAADLRAAHRTASLRRGLSYEMLLPAVPSSRGPPDGGPSSWLTHLAAFIGMAVTVAGMTAAAAMRLGGFVCVSTGGFVAGTGFLRRVRRLQTSASGVRVEFAVGRGWRCAWGDIASVQPPRWPLGGWRIRPAKGRPCTLMPTDVLGNEDVLRAIVVLGRLRFDGRRWVRADAT